ncbi:mechanosensitive ion channel protein 1, mitochondrial-like [Diospyros lotus]|uniref:mechanosensitive ion channel protein 1, mitochondrial-like n=1 Tax=Diospyros lotus TaxID=55363 RepID=UPI002259A79D|nr:mechanosensitive ion channel protein 1, mitochondrial-like [Diospyros lotus]
MGLARFSILKSLSSPISTCYARKQLCPPSVRRIANYADQVEVRPLFTYATRIYHANGRGLSRNYVKNGFGMMGLESIVGGSQYSATSFVGEPNLRVGRNVSSIVISPVLNCRLYSSFFGGKGDKARDPEVPAASGAGEPAAPESGVAESNWVDMARDGWQSARDAMSYTGERAKEAYTELTPYVQQLLDAHPYLRDVIVPAGSLLTATLLAWLVMPRVLRRFHKYSMQGPATLLSGTALWGPAPYEKSFWGALEGPLRYLITFMAFSQIAVMIAPTTFSSQYIAPAWRGAIIISFVWFLNRWKENVVARSLAYRNVAGVERDKLLTLDKISSVGLFVLGLMALAEACGVAVQSILTVGGIGGVATAFAARDILGNVLSGLSVQISQPFSVGDTIKAGTIEGQVMEIGLTTTSLLSAEKFPITVPNTLFSSQVIVNKSRATWRAMVTKIPLQIDDVGKIPLISEDIKSMLKSNSKVFLEKEPPFCFLSQIERSYAELTLGCNLKHMNKDELYSTQEEILLQSIKIIKLHGASLGSSYEDRTSR